MQPFIVSSNIIAELPSKIDSNLEKLAAIHRINCLASLKSANHGWLGACFSSIELLTCIYHRYIMQPHLPMNQRASLHMSKGHAAAAQYAILAALGCFPVERLLTYKQLNGLPAHCDRNVPGVDSDSGSLGQGLSKAIGNAISNKANGLKLPVFAIMGDGELQEGQLFEAFLTLKKLNPGMCIPIIDRNHLQSDSQTADIKDANDWATVFSGIGLQVLQIDGHSPGEIISAIDTLTASERPGVIIAKTSKGGGTSLTAMQHDTPRRQGIWHGQIPQDDEYLAMLEELVCKASNANLTADFLTYKKHFTGSDTAQSENKPKKDISTGEAFTRALNKLAGNDKDVFVLDADLEKSCKLSEVAEQFGERYLEIGISEQDMCSIAAGLALSGRIAVVNTYASFFKRSLDQIFACITEKVPVIFAAHYAGADYFTDGKSHQAINDIGLMQALGDIDILEPTDTASTEALLSMTLNRMKKEVTQTGRCKPAYIRLHRTPGQAFDALPFFADHHNIIRSTIKTDQRSLIFTSGPHMLTEAIKAGKTLEKEGICLDIVAIAQLADDEKFLKNLVEKAYRIFSLEDHRRESGIGSFIASLGFRNPVRIGARNYSQSTMQFNDMLSFHRIHADEICSVIRKVLGCSHEK